MMMIMIKSAFSEGSINLRLLALAMTVEAL